VGPLPWNDAGPPVLVTAGNRGEMIPAQIDRVGRLGDGVITTYLTDDDCRRLRALCDEALEKHRRPRPGFPMCVYTTVRIEDEVGKAQAVTREFLQKYYGGGVNFNGLMGLGPAGAVAEVLERYQKAGVTDICIRFAGTDQISQLEKFIREVVPAFAMH
jgi:alkanesulfonate monooxygenase SsuD/methylene tetrahydromethanopterin reductase-like flavin-dependent oxidoreductase (luciferase family)